MCDINKKVAELKPADEVGPSATSFPHGIHVVGMMLSAVFIAVSSLFAKMAIHESASSGMITFSRFAMGLVILLIWMGVTRRGIKPIKVKFLVIRALTNLAAVFLFYNAIKYTTIVNANLLNLTYPLFVALLSPMFLSQKLSRLEWVILLLAGVGVYSVVNPRFDGVNVGDIMGLGTGLMAGFAVMALSYVRRENSIETVLFFLLTIGALATLPAAIAEDFSPYTMKTWGLLAACAISGVFGQFLVTTAFKYMSAFAGSLVGTVRVVAAAILGFLFLAEIPTWNVIAGSVILIIAIVWLMRLQATRNAP